MENGRFSGSLRQTVRLSCCIGGEFGLVMPWGTIKFRMDSVCKVKEDSPGPQKFHQYLEPPRFHKFPGLGRQYVTAHVQVLAAF
jgi:hypothetical protein